MEVDLYPEFKQETSLVCVEYPAIVKNEDKMIKTLGGTKNITKTYQDETKRLTLNFRPDDPCCHSVCGDRVEVSSLLLKVRKYRRKKRPDQINKPDEIRYRPEIQGVIKTCYKFNSMCDFQYLPLHNDVENNKLVNMIPHLGVGHKKIDLSLYSRDVPLFLPPAVFSRVDNQQDVLFNNYPKYRQEVSESRQKIGVLRPKRTHNGLYIKFEDNITPKEPHPSSVENLKKAHISITDIFEKVKKLFEERPVWSKNAVRALVQGNQEQLKLVLPVIAYYFLTGPWRSLWVKLGYDPRKEPLSVKYQILDFRIRPTWLNTPNIPIKPKRATLLYNLPNLAQRKGKPNEIRIEDTSASKSTAENGSRNTSTGSNDESKYVFRSGVLPAYRQMFYQMCDIKHAEVENLLAPYLNTVTTRPSCHPKSGWLPEDMAASVRNILSEDVRGTFRKRRIEASTDMKKAKKRSHEAWSKPKRLQVNVEDHPEEAVSTSTQGEEALREESTSRDALVEDDDDDEESEVAMETDSFAPTDSPDVDLSNDEEEDILYQEECEDLDDATDFLDDFDAFQDDTEFLDDEDPEDEYDEDA